MKRMRIRTVATTVEGATSTLSLLIEFPVDSDLSFFFLTWDGWFPDYFLDDTNEETRIQTIIENIQRNLTE